MCFELLCTSKQPTVIPRDDTPRDAVSGDGLLRPPRQLHCGMRCLPNRVANQQHHLTSNRPTETPHCEPIAWQPGREGSECGVLRLVILQTQKANKRMTRRLFSIVAVVTFFSCITHASIAAPLAYDESVDGDLTSPLLVLDAGINTVSGTVSATGTFEDPLGENVEDGDGPIFHIPDGLMLTRVTFLVGNLTFGPANGTNGTILPRLQGSFASGIGFSVLINPSNVLTGIADKNVQQGEVLDFSSELNLPQVGSNASSHGYLSVSTAELGFEYDSAFTYTWVLEAAPVPEPTTALMASIAIGGVLIIRRRRL